MRTYYDTEFLERGSGFPIDMISIGMVREDGAELYLVDKNAPWLEINKHEWLMANVMPHLDNDNAQWLSKAEMQPIVYNFLMEGRTNNPKTWPELFAWFSAYDHLVLSQIFGRMIDLPAGLPMYTHDVRSMVDWFEVKSWPKQVGGNHDALEDARHLKKVYDHVIEVGKINAEKKNQGKH